MSNLNILQSGEDSNALQTNVKSLTETAADIMASKGYNPIEEMIDLAQELKGNEVRQAKLEFELHKELLKYYRPSAQPAAGGVNIQGGSGTIGIHLHPLTFATTSENKEIKGDIVDVQASE